MQELTYFNGELLNQVPKLSVLMTVAICLGTLQMKLYVL